MPVTVIENPTVATANAIFVLEQEIKDTQRYLNHAILPIHAVAEAKGQIKTIKETIKILERSLEHLNTHYSRLVTVDHYEEY